jgi:acyl-CoA dehydrogenase
MESLGLSHLGIDDTDESTGTLLDLIAVVQRAAAQATPVPLVETSLAAWLLRQAGLDVPSGPLTVASAAADARFDGAHLQATLAAVPWGRSADALVVLLDGINGSSTVALVGPESCQVRNGTDLAGQPRDDVSIEGAALCSAPVAVSPDALFLRGALLRSAQIAGALEATSQLTRRYTAERVQFGKPVASFQAVQQHLVSLEQAATLTSLNVDRAAAAARSADGEFEICALKLVANQSAVLGMRSAHQAHGAIGMTREYPLQQLTRRLNTWRLDYGTERQLAPRLGTSAAEGSFHGLVTRNPTTGGNDAR